MLNELNIGLLLAGVGIFLIGIQMLESALKNMMGRPFKLFLRKQTQNPFKAIAGGTIVTAVLQSSSAVNFMVLAFVSTGVITMRNAFAVIMGTNLGTTLDSWIIATIGFKVDIEAYAFPLIGIAGLLLFIYSDRQRLNNILSFIVGFCLLFIGLGFMKDAMSEEGLEAVFAGFAGKSNWVFLLVGFVATTITQSSSATIAITLSILHGNLIEFDSAMAVVIGSEVGTSLKLILGSLNGIAAKRRVAFGNFIYNAITTLIGFSLLPQIDWFITEYLHISDPIIGLVVFQTGINTLNILLFLPFLDPYSRFIENLFTDKNNHLSAYIYKVKPDVPDAAFDLLLKESEYIIYRSMHYNLHTFELEELVEPHLKKYMHEENKKFMNLPSIEQYDRLKQHHGEIQSFYIEFSTHSLTDQLAIETDSLIEAVRSCMHSVESIRDIQIDTDELRNSSDDATFEFYITLRGEVRNTYKKLLETTSFQSAEEMAGNLMAILDQIEKNYKKNLNEIYKAENLKSVAHSDIATLMNLNRELFSSHRLMVMCFKSFLLPQGLEKSFNGIHVEV